MPRTIAFRITLRYGYYTPSQILLYNLGGRLSATPHMIVLVALLKENINPLTTFTSHGNKNKKKREIKKRNSKDLSAVKDP